MTNYTFFINSKIYEQIQNGTISEYLVINSPQAKYKNGNIIIFYNEENVKEKISAKIVNIFYFYVLMEALIFIDKNKLGFTNRKPLTEIEDWLLTRIKVEDIEKYGVIVLEFEKIND